MAVVKEEKWQYYRGICIIFVILIHTLYQTKTSYDYINICIRSVVNFCVPLFVFMAGYFSKESYSFKEIIKKRFPRLLIPLIIWSTIYTFWQLILGNIELKDVFFSIILGNSAVHLYYIFVLVQLTVITPILLKIKNKCNILKFIPFVITIFYYIITDYLGLKYGISIPYYSYYFVAWLAFYYLGILIKESNIASSKYSMFKKYCVISCIVSIIYRMLILKIYGAYSLATSQITFVNIIYSIFVCVMIFLENKQKYNKIVIKTGNYSYGIYFSHLLCLVVIKKIVTFFNLPYLVNIILIFSITYVITYVINMVYYEKIKGRFLWKK